MRVEDPASTPMMAAISLATFSPPTGQRLTGAPSLTTAAA